MVTTMILGVTTQVAVLRRVVDGSASPNPKPQIPDPNPKPKILNPKPKTLNPKP